MRLLRGVYEGPGSHGILRVAASVRGVHAVLRALPSEGYFPALYGSRERSGEAAPVTLSHLDDKAKESLAPGNLARDLSSVVRRLPRTEAVVLARSEAALLSGETVPAGTLPEADGTGRVPELVTCSWEAVGIRETEAAELALDRVGGVLDHG